MFHDLSRRKRRVEDDVPHRIVAASLVELPGYRATQYLEGLGAEESWRRVSNYPTCRMRALARQRMGTLSALPRTMTLKIKVGTLALAEARDVELPQEFAAWHQTARVPPDTYDVFAYLVWSDGARRVQSLSVQCEGTTISSNFRAHVLGAWGKSDNNRNGQRTTVYIHLPTYGAVDTPSPILAQATLCDALVRVEWDPRDHDPQSTTGRMWRFTWNETRKPIVIERPRYGGGTSLAAFEDHRRFAVDGVEMVPGEVGKLDLAFSHLYGIDQLTVGETAVGWSFSDKRSLQVTRLA